MDETCRACAGPTAGFARGVVLGRHEVTYLRCSSCGMVMASDPHWLDEAYTTAIAAMDVGLLDRCQVLANVTATVIRALPGRPSTFLDWAGGYGTLTRLMRDRGVPFRHHDPLATNLFAPGHEVEAVDSARWDLVTAYEVLEHLADPVEALLPLSRSTDLLLTTTQLLPEPAPAPSQWWYYLPETGQHITFYTPDSLRRLADRLGFDGVVSGGFLHLFHRGRLPHLARLAVQHPRAAYLVGLVTSVVDRRRSLTELDAQQCRRREGSADELALEHEHKGYLTGENDQ